MRGLIALFGLVGACGDDEPVVQRTVEIEIAREEKPSGECGSLVVKVTHDAVVLVRGLKPVRVPIGPNGADSAALGEALRGYAADCIGHVDIRAERDVEYGVVIAVMAAAKDRGFEQLTIVAE